MNLYFFTEKWRGGSVFIALIKSATRDTRFVICVLNNKKITEKMKLQEILRFVKTNKFELAGPGKYNLRRDGVLGPQLLPPLHRHRDRPDQEKVYRNPGVRIKKTSLLCFCGFCVAPRDTYLETGVPSTTACPACWAMGIKQLK